MMLSHLYLVTQCSCISSRVTTKGTESSSESCDFDTVGMDCEDWLEEGAVLAIEVQDRGAGFL